MLDMTSRNSIDKRAICAPSTDPIAQILRNCAKSMLAPKCWEHRFARNDPAANGDGDATVEEEHK